MGECSEALAAGEVCCSPHGQLRPAVLLRLPAVPCPVPVGAWLSKSGVLRELAQDIRSAARDAAAGEAVQRPDLCKQLCARRAVSRSTLGYLVRPSSLLLSYILLMQAIF